MTASTSTTPEVGTANIGDTITEIQWLHDAPVGCWVLYVGTLLGHAPRVYEKINADEWQHLGTAIEPTPTSGFLGAVQSGRMHRFVGELPDEPTFEVGTIITDMRQLQRLPIGARITNPDARMHQWEIELVDGRMQGKPLHHPHLPSVPLSNFHLAEVEITSLPGDGEEWPVGREFGDDDVPNLPIGVRFRNQAGHEWVVTEQREAEHVLDPTMRGEASHRIRGLNTFSGGGYTVVSSVDTEPNPNVVAATEAEEEINSLRAENDRLREEQEEFRRKVQDTAMRFAEDNNLCGEVEACLQEMGLERPRSTWEFEVVVTHRVRADNLATENHRIPDESFIRDSLELVDEALSMDSDWENVEITNTYEYLANRVEVRSIERAGEES